MLIHIQVQRFAITSDLDHMANTATQAFDTTDTDAIQDHLSLPRLPDSQHKSTSIVCLRFPASHDPHMAHKATAQRIVQEHCTDIDLAWWDRAAWQALEPACVQVDGRDRRLASCSPSIFPLALSDTAGPSFHTWSRAYMM